MNFKMFFVILVTAISLSSCVQPCPQGYGYGGYSRGGNFEAVSPCGETLVVNGQPCQTGFRNGSKFVRITGEWVPFERLQRNGGGAPSYEQGGCDYSQQGYQQRVMPQQGGYRQRIIPQRPWINNGHASPNNTYEFPVRAPDGALYY